MDSRTRRSRFNYLGEGVYTSYTLIDKKEAGETVEAFGDFDKDKDGKLTLKQFQQAMNQRKNDGADTPGDTTVKKPKTKAEPADVPPKVQPAKPGSDPTK